jgi:hypothetical protein
MATFLLTAKTNLQADNGDYFGKGQQIQVQTSPTMGLPTRSLIQEAIRTQFGVSVQMAELHRFNYQKW